MEKFIESLEQIGAKGAGNEKAVANWNVLSTMSSSSIPRLLDSMNRANDLGDNWIRSAIPEILAKSGLPSLPKDESGTIYTEYPKRTEVPDEPHTNSSANPIHRLPNP